MSEYRRHHAANSAVIFVEVEAGSPKTVRELKPGPYKRNQREPWRPATRPPNKAEALRQFLDAMRQNDVTARSILRPDAAALKAWLQAA